MVALWAANARRRCPRNPTVPGSEMKTQGSVFRARSRDQSKVCRAHAFEVEANFKKHNSLENDSGAFGRKM